jgi:hypothetical protein
VSFTSSPDLSAGDNTYDLKLIPLGAISGRVADAGGEPVQLANVPVEGVEEEETTTDKNGRYRIAGLRTYYPGAATSAEATRVSVPAGGEVTGIIFPCSPHRSSR